MNLMHHSHWILHQNRNVFIWHVLFLAFCCLSVPSISAQEKYYLAKQAFNFPERGTIEGYSVLSKSNQLSFIPPQNFVTSIDNNGSQITSRSEDGTISIDIRIKANDPAELKNLEELKKNVLDQFPGSNIYRHQTMFVDGRTAQAFDLEKFNSNGARWNTRLVVIEFRGGTIEFTFSAPAQSFNSQLFLFSNFLNSFQTKERN